VTGIYKCNIVVSAGYADEMIFWKHNSRKLRTDLVMQISLNGRNGAAANCSG